MSWTKADILPARDAGGAPLALRGCDLDFIADAVRARGGTVAEAADASGGPLSAARLAALLAAVRGLREVRIAADGTAFAAPYWADGDYEPARADGTALSPAPSFVSGWAVPSSAGVPSALSADALRRAFHDLRRMRTAVFRDLYGDGSGLVFTPEEQTVGQGDLYAHGSAEETGGGVKSATRRVTGGAYSVQCPAVRDGAVTVCMRISSFGTTYETASSVVPVPGTASGGVVAVSGEALRALADAEVARRGFAEGVIPEGEWTSSFTVSLGAADGEGEALAPCAAVVARTGAETDISDIAWDWRPGEEEA